MSDRPRLVFLPGLGCDRRMVEGHRAIANADVDVIEWIEPLSENESLASYSLRMAKQIDRIEDGPFYLAGVSLGGMVALEIARDTPNVRGVILIASCRSNRGIPAISRGLAWLCGRSPLWLIRLGRWSLPHMRRFFGIMDQRQVELFMSMLRAADPRFIRWCLRACASWRGSGASLAPVFQVHGQYDYVLPARLAGAVDVVVPGAGHALNVTHTAPVNAAIERWLAQIEDGETSRGSR